MNNQFNRRNRRNRRGNRRNFRRRVGNRRGNFGGSLNNQLIRQRNGTTMRAPQLSADKTICVLKYTGLFNLTTAATLEYQFTGNGLFDPDFTGIGSQPAGFDQWMTFYSRYLCFGSRIKITIINNSTTTNILFTLVPTDIAGGAGTTADNIAQPYSKWRAVGFSQGMNKATIVHTMSTNKLYGKDCRWDDLFTGLASSNPANTWYWLISSDVFPGTTQTYNLYVEIWYETMFFRRAPVELSLNDGNTVLQRLGVNREKVKVDLAKYKINHREEKIETISLSEYKSQQE